jgi:FkbM family methyltransferase
MQDLTTPLDPETAAETATATGPETGPDAAIPAKPGSGIIEGAELRIPKHPLITKGQRRVALRTGAYELKEAEAVKRMVGPEDVVLELGGGIGYISTLLSKTCGARAVHSFEANPGLLDYMAEMHRVNGVTNVTVHHALLAPRKGKPRPFYVRQNFLASSMDETGGNVVDVVEVEVRGLNTTLREIRPTFLVCDIEGAEAALLPAGDWSGLRGAVIELHPQWIGSDGVAAVFDAMQRAGLTYFPRASNGKVVAFKRRF